MLSNLKIPFSGLKILTDIHSSNAFTQPKWGKVTKGKEKEIRMRFSNFLKGWNESR